MICILDPLTCGFTKVLVYELFTSGFGVQQEGNKKVWQGNMNKKRFEKFQQRYPDYYRNDTSSYKAFISKFPKAIEKINSLGKKDPGAKKLVLSIFSTDSWTNLEQLKKAKHSPTDCQGCLRIQYTRMHCQNHRLKPTLIVRKPSFMILMEKSQLFFRIPPMKLWVI